MTKIFKNVCERRIGNVANKMPLNAYVWHA